MSEVELRASEACLTMCGQNNFFLQQRHGSTDQVTPGTEKTLLYSQIQAQYIP